jgi:hypothetical protein
MRSTQPPSSSRWSNSCPGNSAAGEGGLIDPSCESCLGSSQAQRHALQWIIAMADRISSGWDRQTFDEEIQSGIPGEMAAEPVLSPFSNASCGGGGRGEELRLSLIHFRALSPEGSFRFLPGSAEPAGDAEALSSIDNCSRISPLPEESHPPGSGPGTLARPSRFAHAHLHLADSRQPAPARLSPRRVALRSLAGVAALSVGA